LPWTSITQTATGTFARDASTRSAIVFAKASKSMIGVLSFPGARDPETQGLCRSAPCSARAKSAQVGSEPIFCVSGLMEPLLEQGLDPLLRRRLSDRSPVDECLSHHMDRILCRPRFRPSGCRSTRLASANSSARGAPSVPASRSSKLIVGFFASRSMPPR
jgi:hypothetical protein